LKTPWIEALHVTQTSIEPLQMRRGRAGCFYSLSAKILATLQPQAAERNLCEGPFSNPGLLETLVQAVLAMSRWELGGVSSATF